MHYLGWPVVALSIGVLIAYRSTKREQGAARVSDWVENALRSSAMVIMVVGLGGALSQILRQTPAVDAIARGMESTGLPAIFRPFVLGVVGNMITGSTTVSVITSASIVAPTMPALGLSPQGDDAVRLRRRHHHEVRELELLLGLYLSHADAAAIGPDLLRRRDDREWLRVHGGHLRAVDAEGHLGPRSASGPARLALALGSRKRQPNANVHRSSPGFCSRQTRPRAQLRAISVTSVSSVVRKRPPRPVDDSASGGQVFFTTEVTEALGSLRLSLGLPVNPIQPFFWATDLRVRRAPRPQSFGQIATTFTAKPPRRWGRLDLSR